MLFQLPWLMWHHFDHSCLTQWSVPHVLCCFPGHSQSMLLLEKLRRGQESHKVNSSFSWWKKRFEACNDSTVKVLKQLGVMFLNDWLLVQQQGVTAAPQHETMKSRQTQLQVTEHFVWSCVLRTCQTFNKIHRNSTKVTMKRTKSQLDLVGCWQQCREKVVEN